MKQLFESWRRYVEVINESKFLKEVHTLGYLETGFYPGIINMLQKYQKDKDYMNDENHLIWDYQNEQLTDDLNKFTFVKETQTPFDLKHLRFTREPIELRSFNFGDLGDTRVNHFMVKTANSSEFILGGLEKYPEIKKFISECYDYANDMGLDTNNRYGYITIDQMEVKADKSQRETGWHIDGMQGTEVPYKKNVDFQFIWADQTPTKFCTMTFNMEGANEAKHNIFKWVGKQVDENLCYYLQANKVYLMNAYHVHTATKSSRLVFRKFVRLSFTNTPITSVRMTINPAMEYDYEIGTTTGAIPSHLTEKKKQ